MPKIVTKQDAIERVKLERRRLEQNLMRLSPEQMLLPGVVGEWSVKDVLAHLTDWEERFIRWYENSQHGDHSGVPDPGYSWKESNQLNQRIYETHCNEPLEQVMREFHAVHARFVVLIEAIAEGEMLRPGAYPWLGKDSLKDWISQYGAHDLWGKTKIRKWMKAQSIG